jgi:hypothetical protein
MCHTIHTTTKYICGHMLPAEDVTECDDYVTTGECLVGPTSSYMASNTRRDTCPDCKDPEEDKEEDAEEDAEEDVEEEDAEEDGTEKEDYSEEDPAVDVSGYSSGEST